MEVSACVPQFLKIYGDIDIFAGQNFVTKKHSHHALEIIISFDSLISLKVDNEEVEAKGFIIKPDHMHQTSVEGFAVFLYLNPEAPLSKKLNYLFKAKSVFCLDDDRVAKIKSYLRALIRCDYSQEDIKDFFTEALLEDITQIEFNFKIDERILNVITYIKFSLNAPHNFKQLIDIACLSESRLTHLFKKEVGIPIRKFILWCRIQKAIKLVLRGYSLTQAASLSGFSDVAHLTRTFVSMFGVTPSQMLKNTNQGYFLAY